MDEQRNKSTLPAGDTSVPRMHADALVYDGRHPAGSSEESAMATDGVQGQYKQINGDRVYQIANSHLMDEFFVTLVSSSDHWMFVSSRGALTAGRQDCNNALFPYYSADKISDLRHCTGPETILRVRRNGHTRIWQPFKTIGAGDKSIIQNLYKNDFGNKLWFEEVNESLGLTFRYCWTFGERFGIIRNCYLENMQDGPVSIQILDGLQNILPYGIDQGFQLRFSNLADAYKKAELEDQLGVFYLSSIPTDKAEPSEGLRATIVWQSGLDASNILLSDQQVSRFVQTGQVVTETDVRARRGAYFVRSEIELPPFASQKWMIVSALEQDSSDLIDLRDVASKAYAQAVVDEDVEDCQNRLLQILSSADGRQLGNDSLKTHRHQSNVLFNVMRGGFPFNGYEVERADFCKHVNQFNAAVYQRNSEVLESLPPQLSIDRLISVLTDQNEPDLLRLGLEYLPISFSRRHGDPTRPWNHFEIKVKDENGNPDLNYQGNWRDIFQNWEALAHSWPAYASSMIFRFVNASTADGYNPYRITKNGIEWEEPDPEDPWANIGYWGDHQIIYLLKLLELQQDYFPGGLDQWLDAEYCTYTQVPYRIRPYEDIQKDPRDTIDFDVSLAKQIEKRVEAFGADGKLLQNRDGGIYRATLGEKLLVPALAKLSNFVPEGGIWLNTQRPEWNDANNALAGYGLSMVTVYHLRRYMAFLRDWFKKSSLPQFLVSKEVVTFLRTIDLGLRENKPNANEMSSPQERLQLVETLSKAGSVYRESLYDGGLGGDKEFLSVADCINWFNVSLAHLDHAIEMNQRDDGLFHSYNLVSFDTNDQGITGCQVEYLTEMLEGQVAILGSGSLPAEESIRVMEALRNSEMYREDQNSYLLYPDRQLPRFAEKNQLSSDVVEQTELLRALQDDDNQQVAKQDKDGGWHFNGDFRNANDLNATLDRLAADPRYQALVQKDRALLQEAFEATFHHRYFTGRSGTFFGYEGLGSIYWHMVSKLQLAAQECMLGGDSSDIDLEMVDRLRKCYFEIREGTGVRMTPQQYGAFPTDPYSHTPRHAGAQQPGMTGQVKEDILSRLGEVGVQIRNGIVFFRPVLFDQNEFLTEPGLFRFFNTQGVLEEVVVEADRFAFTFCQVLVIYQRSNENSIVVHSSKGEITSRLSCELTESESKSLFHRDHAISKIEVNFSPDQFRYF